MTSVAVATMRIKEAFVPGELQVETISDFQRFLELEPIWNALIEEAEIGHPFLNHEWVKAWWESFGTGKELHILLVRSGGEPVAIAPLMLTRSHMYGVKVRRLEFIYNVHTPRFDFIIARRHDDVYRTLWNYFAQEKSLWDVLQLFQLPEDSRTLAEFSRMAEREGLQTGLWPSGKSPFVPLTENWDDYFKTLARKHRSNMRNRLNRLSRLGEVKLEVMRSVEELESSLEDGLRIEAAAWKGAAGTAIASRTDLRQFYTSIGHAFAQRGRLRLHFLTLDGQRIAFEYSLEYRKKIFVLKVGYDPHYAAYSPCNMLCYLVLQEAFARGLEEYDFLGVDNDWKLEWTDKSRSHYWLYVFQKGLAPRFVHYLKFRLLPELKQHRYYAPLCRGALRRVKALKPALRTFSIGE